MVAFSRNMFESELAEYYDVMHHHRNYCLECQFADSVIQEYCVGAKRVLDIGCGTGEHAIKMAQHGYEVMAIDASQDMIRLTEEKAKKAGVPIEARCADMYDLNTIGEFQAAYCLGYTLLYMTTYQQVKRFLSTVNRALLPRGVLLIDFLNGWSLMEDFPRDKFVYKHEDTTIFRFEQASLNKKKRVKHIEFYYVIQHDDGRVKTIFSEEDLRIFFADEVHMLLSNSGFESIKSFGNYSLDTGVSEDTRVVILAGQKTNQ